MAVSVINQLDFSGLKEPLVIHSGLKGLRGLMPMKDVPQAVLRALEGLLVVMPAYTPQFARTGVYDVVRSTPSTGAICEAFDGQRTKHPMNSYKANFDIPPLAGGWGADSMMGWLLENDATFVALGVSPLNSCSYFHYAEAQMKVPYRYPKTFRGLLYDDGKPLGECQETLLVGPRGVEYDFKADWALEALEYHKLIERRPHMQIIKIKDIVDIAIGCLHKDPYSLIHPTQQGRDRVREYVESGKLQDEQA